MEVEITLRLLGARGKRREDTGVRMVEMAGGESAGEKARLVLRLVENLNIKFGFEQSFKMFAKTLLANRFLLGFKKERIRQEPEEKILDLCRRLGMPENLLRAYRESLGESKYLHFGFEENERTCLYKAYLEFFDKVERTIKTHPGKFNSFLMHLGFKWDALHDGKQALTRYTWYPIPRVEEMRARLSRILDPHKHEALLETAKGMVDQALRVIPPYDIFYMEVTEEDNPRRSFDINMYRAKLPLRELQPGLEKMCEYYAVPSAEFHILYEAAKSKIFGHVAGGIDREGRDFLTIYYGVEYTSPHDLGDPYSDKNPTELRSP